MEQIRKKLVTEAAQHFHSFPQYNGKFVDHRLFRVRKRITSRYRSPLMVGDLVIGECHATVVEGSFVAKNNGRLSRTIVWKDPQGKFTHVNVFDDHLEQVV